MMRKEMEEACRWLSDLTLLEERIEKLEESRDAHALKCKHWSVVHVPRATAECDSYTACEWCGKDMSDV